jgi:hypothetical protein
VISAGFCRGRAIVVTATVSRLSTRPRTLACASLSRIPVEQLGFQPLFWLCRRGWAFQKTKHSCRTQLISVNDRSANVFVVSVNIINPNWPEHERDIPLAEIVLPCLNYSKRINYSTWANH